MPTITVNLKQLFNLIGQEMTRTELEQHCFDYGLEVEDDGESVETVKLELPANRYDLLSVEGVALALRSLLKNSHVKHSVIPKESISDYEKTSKLVVRKSVESLRPFCVAGILRNLSFDEDNKKSFMDLQDKLHHGLGKLRTLVSIGTHDLDKVQGPFEFVGEKLSDAKFQPLNLDKEMTGHEVLEHFKNDKNMRDFTKIIPQESEMYPFIKDSTGKILSMPPLINSDFSKIETTTKNVFVEVTATDETKALMALNVVITLFGSYSQTPFSFQQLEIDYEGRENLNKTTPNFDLARKIKIRKNYIARLMGQSNFTDEQVVLNLEKMGLTTVVTQSSDVAQGGDSEYEVDIPIHRTDVLHQCDVAEDFCIAFGYNNIEVASPQVVSIGKEFLINKLTEQMRIEMGNAGFSEGMPFVLCSVKSLTTKLLKESDKRIAHIGNPKASDFEAGRTTLLPGLLDSIEENKKNKLPLKMFEIGDVILKVNAEGDDMKGMWNHQEIFDKTIGAVNQRRLAVVCSNVNSSDLDITHGTLDYVFKKMFLKKKYSYKLRRACRPFLFGELQSDIFLVNNETKEEVYSDEPIGYMGVVHPLILKEMGWKYPISCLELNFQLLADLV